MRARGEPVRRCHRVLEGGELVNVDGEDLEWGPAGCWDWEGLAGLGFVQGESIVELRTRKFLNKHTSSLSKHTFS